LVIDGLFFLLISDSNISQIL